MDSEPLISIVLPVWNGQRYLAQAIESILSQTYKNFELIVVNDCSTDRSLQIAQAYQEVDSRIFIENNLQNLKLPASLNKGFSVARGAYFTWTSDDNILESNFFDTLIFELKNSDADIIYSDFNSIDDDGFFLNLSAVGLPEQLVSQNTIGASFMYRRQVHESIGGYDTDKFLYEDYDFWVRAYLFGFKFKRLNNVIYNYRRHQANLTSTRAMPSDYPIYRYQLRRKFRNISRSVAYDAREILLGYSRELGYFKTFLILIEATFLNPIKTFKWIFPKLKKILLKIFDYIFKPNQVGR